MMYEFDGYDEILKCYEGVTDIHASTSFEVGLMNDRHHQLLLSALQLMSRVIEIHASIILPYVVSEFLNV